jgi:glycosyltransferase involved in cell wall biosynthesis
MDTHNDSKSPHLVTPTVSIGLAVFNGENYLVQSIQSILDQTFDDYELIISDNCSTDRTEQICREFSSKSDKITYYRQPWNMGAAANFEFVFQKSRGKYFKWQGHDDYAHPLYLEKCVARFEQDPDAVLCQSHVELIDENGKQLGVYAHEDFGTTDPDPITRFAGRLRNIRCAEVLGIIPRRVLENTERLGPFVSHDRCLLSHLALMGRFLDVSEVLFAFRIHPNQFTQSTNKGNSAMRWFDPNRANWPTLKRYTHIVKCIGYINSVNLDRWTRIRCYGTLFCAHMNRGHIKGLITEFGRLTSFGFREILSRLTGRSPPITQIPKSSGME